MSNFSMQSHQICKQVSSSLVALSKAMLPPHILFLTPHPITHAVVFNPADHLQFWPQRFQNSKAGLVGGHTMIANVGAYTPGSGGGGFELVAFAPVFAADTAATPTDTNIDLPRQQGVNYSPCVLVRLREQQPGNSTTSLGEFVYFRVSNSTIRPNPAQGIRPHFISFQFITPRTLRRVINCKLPF